MMAMRFGKKRTVILIAIVVLFPVLMVAAYMVSVLLADRSADNRAREFCAQTLIGSNISDAIARATSAKIYWSLDRDYNFWFRGSFLSGAICSVTVGGDGRVKSTSTTTYND